MKFQEVFRQHERLFYCDSSIKWKTGDLSRIFNTVADGNIFPDFFFLIPSIPTHPHTNHATTYPGYLHETREKQKMFQNSINTFLRTQTSIREHFNSVLDAIFCAKHSKPSTSFDGKLGINCFNIFQEL
jgi:hypothetical protein